MSQRERRRGAAAPRRAFLTGLGAGLAASVIAPRPLFARAARPADRPVILGAGAHTYEWVKDWAKLPAGMRFGNTHGAVVIDAQGRVYMNTDTEHAVIVFDPAGKFIKSWGKELKAGAPHGGTHGMMIRKEGRAEYIYLVHISRHQFAKYTLDGEMVWVKDYPKESGVYEKAEDFRPTGIAVAPNGDLYVTDGYGKSWVHHYDARGNYVRSWGGPAGSEPGKLKQPHGIWIDTRGKTPRVLLADRQNRRLQWFGLDGQHVGLFDQDLRLPSNFAQRGGDLAVADLAGRVTILDKDNRLVAHLGDNPDPQQRGKNPIPPEQWVDGRFISPHCPRWDAQGNLYVLEWLSTGRIVKLKRMKG